MTDKIEGGEVMAQTHAALVERLRYTHEHGLFDANVAGMLASPKEAAQAITDLEAEIARKDNAMRDALAAWQYIRANHGDLYGVGWDRVEAGLVAALKDTQ